jgi:Periplasmic component of the Tol biopolymer transport system
MLVALSCSADDSPSVSLTGTPMTTPTPTPKLAPWSTASAVPVDRDAILAGDNEAWFAVDPNTGQTKRLEPVSGYVPRELAGGRYDLLTTTSGTLVRVDVASGQVTDIGAGWTGQVTADGKWAVILPQVEGSTLAVVDVDSEERFDLGQLGKPVTLAWSPNDTLAIVHDEALYLARGPDWQPQRIGDFNYVWPVWSPDSHWLAVADTGGIRLIDPDSGEERLLPPPNGVGGGGVMAWSPDGKRLAVGGGSGWYVDDVETGQVTNVAPNSALPQGPMTPVWSPDGSEIAVLVIPSKADPDGIAVAQADGSGARMIATGAGSNILAWTDAGILMRLSSPMMP